MGIMENPETGETYKPGYKIKGDVTPYTSINIPVEILAQDKKYTPMETNQKTSISLRLCDNYTMPNNFLDPIWTYYGCVISNRNSSVTNFWTGTQFDNTMMFKRATMGIRPSGSLLNAITVKTIAPMKEPVSYTHLRAHET